MHCSPLLSYASQKIVFLNLWKVYASSCIVVCTTREHWRNATLDIYGMTSCNSTFLKEMLHSKEKQEAALNVPCTE